jgi:hypothetical protein
MKRVLLSAVLALLIAPAARANVTNFELSVITFAVTGGGYDPIFFQWQSTPTTQGLDFFGVTSAPGICLQALLIGEPSGPVCPPAVPEPHTAALLGLGLVALASVRRRA